jgi:hypothetical protein
MLRLVGWPQRKRVGQTQTEAANQRRCGAREKTRESRKSVAKHTCDALDSRRSTREWLPACKRSAERAGVVQTDQRAAAFRSQSPSHSQPTSTTHRMHRHRSPPVRCNLHACGPLRNEPSRTQRRRGKLTERTVSSGPLAAEEPRSLGASLPRSQQTTQQRYRHMRSIVRCARPSTTQTVLKKSVK